MVYCTAQGFILLGFMLASTKGPSCPNSPGAECYEIACRIEMAAAGTLPTAEWPEPREPFSKWRPNTTVSLKVVLEKATLFGCGVCRMMARILGAMFARSLRLAIANHSRKRPTFAIAW